MTAACLGSLRHTPRHARQVVYRLTDRPSSAPNVFHVTRPKRPYVMAACEGVLRRPLEYSARRKCELVRCFTNPLLQTGGVQAKRALHTATLTQ